MGKEKERADKLAKDVTNERLKLAADRETLVIEKRKVEEERVTMDREMVGLTKRVEQLAEEREWLVSQVFAYVVSRLMHSHEFKASLVDIYAKAMAVGRHAGVIAGFKAAESKLRLEDQPAHNPGASQEFVDAVKAMERLTYPYIQVVGKCHDQPLSVL